MERISIIMIKFLVDSSSDYSLDEIQENNLELVPIAITLDETTYRDTIELERSHFYELLLGSKNFPQTSQPSPQAFLEKFLSAKERGDELICVLLSSGLSGTCQSAHLAKNMAEYDNIHIIDSLAATHIIRLMVDYGMKLRDNGLSAAEIVTELETLQPRIRVVAGVDTLEYLCKGGRLSKTSAAIGELANLKPMLTIKPDGTLTVLGKCIGRNKAIQFITKYVQEHMIDTLFPMYSIYTVGTDNCERMEEKLTSLGYTIDQRCQIGSTIGAHLGPGTFGVIYVEK